MPLLNAITFKSRGEGSIEPGDGRWGQMEEIPTDASQSQMDSISVESQAVETNLGSGFPWEQPTSSLSFLCV